MLNLLTSETQSWQEKQFPAEAAYDNLKGYLRPRNCDFSVYNSREGEKTESQARDQHTIHILASITSRSCSYESLR